MAPDRRRTGLRRFRSGPPPAPVLPGAARPAEAAALSRLVRAVARRPSPGGALRLTAGGPAERPPCGAGGPAALGRPPHGADGHARVLLRDLARPATPPPAILRDLFGLTPAEAGVAAALSGGATAEAVAAARGIGVPTVRGQVRTILEKTGAANLRDLERIPATPAAG